MWMFCSLATTQPDLGFPLEHCDGFGKLPRPHERGMPDGPHLVELAVGSMH